MVAWLSVVTGGSKLTYENCLGNSLSPLYACLKNTSIINVIYRVNQSRIRMMMTIFFIWLGSVIPPKYQAVYQQCQRQYGKCQLLGEKEQKMLMQKYQWNATNLLVIQRADILRMLALQEYGGIFIDLDIRVYDWQYLKLLDCTGHTYFGEEQLDARIDQIYLPSNWFICSGKNSTEMQRLLDNIDQTHTEDVLSYAGPEYLKRMKVKMMLLYPKIRHCFDNTWYKGGDGCSFQGRDLLMYFGGKCFWYLVYCLIIIGALVVAIVVLTVRGKRNKQRQSQNRARYQNLSTRDQFTQLDQQNLQRNQE